MTIKYEACVIGKSYTLKPEFPFIGRTEKKKIIKGEVTNARKPICLFKGLTLTLDDVTDNGKSFTQHSSRIIYSTDEKLPEDLIVSKKIKLRYQNGTFLKAEYIK